MSGWQKATMDNLYYNPEYQPDLDDRCLVRIGGDLITVKYDDDGELVVWQGREVAPDHFELHSPAASGRATLHRFPGANVLVGGWIEEGERGMWHIEIDR